MSDSLSTLPNAIPDEKIKEFFKIFRQYRRYRSWMRFLTWFFITFFFGALIHGGYLTYRYTEACREVNPMGRFESMHDGWVICSDGQKGGRVWEVVR